MPDTSVALTVDRQPPRSAAQDRPAHKPRIGKKLFQAIELIVFQGLPLDEAAAQAELTTFQLRQAFGRAHVLAHLRQRREVLRAAASGKNILRLCEIRDAADNMPAVNAIKTLEQIGDELGNRNIGSSAGPIFAIRIVNVVQPGAETEQTVRARLTDASDDKSLDDDQH